jgi:ribose transport system ATP-binding protein
MTMAGEVVDIRRPADALRLGVGFLSSNRAQESLAEALNARENLFANVHLGDGSSSRVVWPGRERVRAGAVMRDFDITPADPERQISTFSGGNQQKLALARSMGFGGRVLILEEPTTGVDVGSKAEVYRKMGRACEVGSGVLLISSDLEEVAMICDRALVFSRGRIVGEVPRAELSVERLTLLASEAA